MVSVKDLHHSFEGRPVLKGISFEVEAGEVMVIMGSSGGGKTTLLKCIAGLIKPDKGQVLVDGIDMVKEPEKAVHNVSLVFQYAALFDYLNVAQNILFGVERRRRLSKAEKAQIVEEGLAEVGLTDSAHLMPSELSGGMRKRVGLARALAAEPKVILYDEPTSGLDPVTAYSIDQLIVETRDRRRVTSLVVSHDVSSVLRVADRIAFLHQGELLFLGTTEEFKEAQQGEIKEIIEKSQAETLVNLSASES